MTIIRSFPWPHSVLRVPFYRRIAPVLSALCLLLCVLPCQALDVKDVPNPRTGHAGWVTDSAGVLAGYAPDIEARLSALQRDTGAEVAVVVLPSIGEQSPREFATALLKHWGVGRKGQDDGVLVLHVLDQRRVEIETGYGAEAVLPDATCSWLIQEVAVPLFRNGAMGQGHVALSRGIDHALRHPGVGHDALVAAARAGMDTSSAAPVPVQSVVPASRSESRSWLGRLEARKNGWLLGALLAALAALAVRVRAHRAFHREKASRFTAPWASTLAGGILSGGLLGAQKIWNEPKIGLFAASLLSLTALGVFARGVWLQVQARKRYAPRSCSACGAPMRRLEESADDAYLEDGQQTEERIESRDHDVWLCACGNTQKVAYKGPKPAKQCKSCSYFTDRQSGSTVISPATHSSSGLREDYFTCAQCGAKRTVRVTLAQLSSSGSGSSSGGGGSSSFGGGRSGGGGAGGSY